MSTTEKQALQAQKVAQKVAEYHSKLAATSKIGLFSKLNPKIRGKNYASLFEDVLKPEESDTPCPCRLTPGECGHSGSYVYKPLKHLRPFLALLATCKLFRNEAQALLYVDYIPKTAWIVRGKDGPKQLRDFLRCIRPQQPEKMLFAWRLEDVDVDSVPTRISSTNLLSDGVADWLSAAIYRHDQVFKEEQKKRDAEIQEHIQWLRSPRDPRPKPHGPRRRMRLQDVEKALDDAYDYEAAFPPSYRTGRTGVRSTRRFYLGHRYVEAGEKVSVVVNGPLQRLFWKTWEMKEAKKESKQRWERIVSM